MNRLFGTIITLIWLVCMAALIHRDVVPFLSAQEPPGKPIPPGRFQVAITNDSGRSVGTTWVRITPLAAFRTVQSITRLDLRALSPSLSFAAEIVLESEFTYDDEDELEEFAFQLHAGAFPIRVTGVRYHEQFACTARFGRITKTMSFDGRLSKVLGQSLRPFTHLEGLHIGQRWRLRLLDPLALLRGESLEFKTQLVEVTGRERILYRGQPVETFRIETDGAIAWVDDAGFVLRQQLSVPFLGKWRLEREPFDTRAYRRTQQKIKQLKMDRARKQRAPAGSFENEETLSAFVE